MPHTPALALRRVAQEDSIVLKQRHEIELACALTEAFAALVAVVAKGRWAGEALVQGSVVPHPGCEYAQQRGKVLRRGKVLACLRPVSMTLQETLLDPPCCVKLRLHWRIEPTERGSCVLLDARYSLNGAAALRRRHWYERIHGHCSRMQGALESCIAEAQET
jgi:hypothetical protein